MPNYSVQVIAEALFYIYVKGYSLDEVHSKLGMSVSSLYSWKNSFEKVFRSKKRDVTEIFMKQKFIENHDLLDLLKANSKNKESEELVLISKNVDDIYEIVLEVFNSFNQLYKEYQELRCSWIEHNDILAKKMIESRINLIDLLNNEVHDLTMMKVQREYIKKLNYKI
ncbi:hypothetical protein [Acinetobacter variabilis]|uniref:hypothetical protein n=1 Tax=Acinetobacter variabilis TaxID=70346 RepID=UPI0026730361|nr:hypothetical protein [Acinetobacter variabilis]WKT72198.1 hypothetical protein Q3F87_10065 [Acinetobacter variabilis]